METVIIAALCALLGYVVGFAVGRRRKRVRAPHESEMAIYEDYGALSRTPIQAEEEAVIDEFGQVWYRVRR